MFLKFLKCLTLNYLEVTTKMPVAIETAGIRFPVGYSPWYVYEATISDPLLAEDIEFMDLLIPTTGTGVFTRPVISADEVVSTGYCFALEKVQVDIAEAKVIQVAVPGSLVPLVSGSTSIRPTMVNWLVVVPPTTALYS